mgnify:CR=1 FL=1
MRFGFLKEHRGEIGPIKKACGLVKVSKSGFCEYLGRKKSDARIERHKGRYGYRRIDRELRKAASSWARGARPASCGSSGLPERARPENTASGGRSSRETPRLSLAERAFAVGGRNRLWAGDVTCTPTREGRPCLAAVIDAFSRKVVGWSMPERVTEKAAIDAVGQAVGREGPPDDGDLVFHDD